MNIPMSPGSSSLINFFSNNKQGFLSGRSAAIQQQMVQNQSQRIIPQNRSMPSPVGPVISASRISKPEVVATPEAVVKETVNTEEVAEKKEVVAKTDELLYPVLKDSTVPIEKIGIESALLRKWLLTRWIKHLRSKEVLTVGDLCSLNVSEINSLPFKSPKLENFMSFIKKFEVMKNNYVPLKV